MRSTQFHLRLSSLNQSACTLLRLNLGLTLISVILLRDPLIRVCGCIPRKSRNLKFSPSHAISVSVLPCAPRLFVSSSLTSQQVRVSCPFSFTSTRQSLHHLMPPLSCDYVSPLTPILHSSKVSVLVSLAHLLSPLPCPVWRSSSLFTAAPSLVRSFLSQAARLPTSSYLSKSLPLFSE